MHKSECIEEDKRKFLCTANEPLAWLHVLFQIQDRVKTASVFMTIWLFLFSFQCWKRTQILFVSKIRPFSGHVYFTECNTQEVLLQKLILRWPTGVFPSALLTSGVATRKVWGRQWAATV